MLKSDRSVFDMILNVTFCEIMNSSPVSFDKTFISFCFFLLASKHTATQVSKVVVHELEFGDIAVMQI